MACYHPFYLRERETAVPCNRCVGCQKEYARQWSVRCMHEASLHPANCMLTLTYDDVNLPPFGSLVSRDLQLFWKRLRKATGATFSYFACGEYGSRTNRPHYHALVFGFDFLDKRLWAVRHGERCYRSPLLERVWRGGLSEVGSVTARSARYVAGYVAKKWSSRYDPEAYVRERVDGLTGEVLEEFEVEKEFSRMSNRRPIGKEWYARFGKEVRVTDSVVVEGREQKPPRYYDKLFRGMDEKAYSRVKELREQSRDVADSVPSRLLVKEGVVQLSVRRERGL